jgi:hypothetical protein
LDRFVGILPEGCRILISHSGGHLEEIDLKRFPHLRRAAAISIRQAYYAPANARLKIELTTSRYAWASLLLAVRRAETSKLWIHPSVARDADELLSVVRRSIPSALSSELVSLTDPEAELTRLLEQTSQAFPSHSPGPQIEMEKFPLPDNAAHSDGPWPYVPKDTSRSNAIRAEPIKTQIPREMLHEKIWEILASTADGQDVVNQLEAWAASENRDETFGRLVELYNGKPMEAVVRAFMNPTEPAERPDEEEMDEPLDLMDARPREWSAFELGQFRYDIETFDWQFRRWSSDLAQMPTIEQAKGP